MESIANYLDPRTLAKLQGLALRARHVVDGYLSGAHRSAHHGYSAEFSQHRPYAPGDDLRNIDWKAFGRTDRLYVKQFVDETNLSCTFLMDVSASMGYQGSSAPMSKYEYASCVVTALAWLLRTQGDAVGLTTFGASCLKTLPPQANDQQIAQFISTLEQATMQTDTSIDRVFGDWSNTVSGRKMVVIVSDLFDELHVITNSIVNLKNAGHELIVFQICDRDECEFPFHELVQFVDSESEQQLTLDAEVYRQRYLRQFERFVDEVRRTCQRASIDFLQVTTDRPFDLVISQMLLNRSRIRSSTGY